MSLTINLPPHLKDYLEREVASGRFVNEEAAVVYAVEQVIDEYRWEEDGELLIAIAEADGGEGEPLTSALMDRLVAEATENARRGIPVPDDVAY